MILNGGLFLKKYKAPHLHILCYRGGRLLCRDRHDFREEADGRGMGWERG